MSRKVFEFVTNAGFLVGWKSIGNYLGVSHRSVQRNWKIWGLPLFFLENKVYKIPVCHIADIEAWKNHKIRKIMQENID